MDEFTINLWVFPQPDFAHWCELTGNDLSKIPDHAGYMTMIAAIQADQEHQGHTVRRVQMTVAEMRDALAANNWPNDTQHRAAVIAARK